MQAHPRRPDGAEPDSVIDVRAVFQQGHRDLAVDELPPVLLPRKGRFGLTDYEKAFAPDPAAGDIFDVRGVDRETGCMVAADTRSNESGKLPSGWCLEQERAPGRSIRQSWS